MSYEILLVAGSVLFVFSFVAVMTAWAEGRRMRRAAIVVMVSIGLLGLAIMQDDDGMIWRDVPDAFVTVIAMVVN